MQCVLNIQLSIKPLIMNRSSFTRNWRTLLGGLALSSAIVVSASVAEARTADAIQHQSEQLIPILGVTVDHQEPIGAVAYLVLAFQRRNDQEGLAVHFVAGSGRFSPMAQTSMEQAIRRAARSLRLSTDSWTVMLSVPHEGVTIYGDSLSAMVGLSVAALAQGKIIRADRSITGTVTPDGHIGSVGAVHLKIIAAYEAQLRRVLVPEEYDPTDGDWKTPFLMQVSPVGSVTKAYAALVEDDSTIIPVNAIAKLQEGDE
jgi:hypothetical protein